MCLYTGYHVKYEHGFLCLALFSQWQYDPIITSLLRLLFSVSWALHCYRWKEVDSFTYAYIFFENDLPVLNFLDQNLTKLNFPYGMMQTGKYTPRNTLWHMCKHWTGLNINLSPIFLYLWISNMPSNSSDSMQSHGFRGVFGAVHVWLLLSIFDICVYIRKNICMWMVLSTFQWLSNKWFM